MAELNFAKLLNSGDLIRPDELAKGLKVAQGTVYAWVERGLIPHIRLEKCIRFDPAEIREWLEKKRKAAKKNPGGGTPQAAT
jgi:excisionase family DNA binding protein